MININITYQQIIDQLATSIYNVIDNNSTLPSAFRSGYSTTVASVSSGGPSNISATAYISSSISASSVSKQTIINDINNYVTRLGISTTASPTPRGLITFFNALAAYTSNALSLCTSEFSSSVPILFSSVGSSTSVISQASGDIATALDITSMINVLTSYVCGSARHRICTYSYSITSCSSSSSCSCSSSSSCTSIYIAYYKILD